MTTKPTPRRNSWNFRIAPDDDELVRAASSATGATLSSFVREAAITEARRVLADRTIFELDEPEWERFQELLAREPRVSEGLRELFSKPSVFE